MWKIYVNAFLKFHRQQVVCLYFYLSIKRHKLLYNTSQSRTLMNPGLSHSLHIHTHLIIKISTHIYTVRKINSLSNKKKVTEAMVIFTKLP